MFIAIYSSRISFPVCHMWSKAFFNTHCGRARAQTYPPVKINLFVNLLSISNHGYVTAHHPFDNSILIFQPCTKTTRDLSWCRLTISTTRTLPRSKRREPRWWENSGSETRSSGSPMRPWDNARFTTESMPREIADLWSWSTWRWSRLTPCRVTWGTRRTTHRSKRVCTRFGEVIFL